MTPGCFDKGGISRYSRYQIQALREIFTGGQVRVYSLLGPDDQSFEDKFEVNWSGKSGKTMDRIWFTLRILATSFFWRPDFIHSAHINFNLVSKFAAFIGGSKIIQNVYGLELWNGRDNDVKRGLRWAHTVISDCHNTSNFIVSNKFSDEAKIEVIWDCVDLTKFKPNAEKHHEIAKKYRLPSRDEHFIILTLGRIAYAAIHKGYHRLIEVFASIAKECPKARLVFAGKGDMVEELKQLAEQKGIKDKVVFAGMIHEDDMAAIYSYGHVFSLVSEVGHGKGEGIPLTPLEAMACGTPIIVGNEDGSREAIFNEQNGYCIDPNDLVRHAEHLKHLYTDETARNRIVDMTINVARQHFSYETFCDKHRKLFRRI